MHAVEAIRIAIETADMIAQAYLADLSDQEMMHRPCPGCNHVKWQLGHLILSDHEMINGCRPGTLPDLPDRFEQQYANSKQLLTIQTIFTRNKNSCSCMKINGRQR